MTRRDGISYSPAEEKLLKILTTRKKPVSSVELVELFYDGAERPFHAQGGINVTIRSLIRKAAHNREDFVIERSERRGPYPIEFRLVRKSRRNLAAG